MGEITERVCKAFGKCYLLAMKDVLIEEAEEKQQKFEKLKEKREKKIKKLKEKGIPIVEKTGPKVAKPAVTKETRKEADEKAIKKMQSGRKPRRPRIDFKPDKPEKDRISCNVTKWEVMDSDIDPYVSFTIESSYQDREGLKNHRFGDFIKLHKKLAKIEPPGTTFPATGKGGDTPRDVSPETNDQRQKDLQAYLTALTNSDDLGENEDLQEFLGVEPSGDARDQKIFEKALELTKFELNIWATLNYDTPAQGVARIVIHEIRREMWKTITDALPPSEKLRKLSMKIAYKTMNATVDPAVTKAVNAAKESTKEVRQKCIDMVAKFADLIVKTKAAVKDKLKDGIGKAFEPIQNILAKVMTKVLANVIPVILLAINTGSAKLLPALKDVNSVLQKGDVAGMDKVCSAMEDAKKDVVAKINESLSKSVETCVGTVTVDITMDDLKDMISPLKMLCKIVDAIADVIDPKHWAEPTRIMMRFREELKQMDPSKHHEIDHKLDHQEHHVMWRTYYCGRDIRGEGKKLYRRLRRNFPDSGPIPDAFLELSRDIAKRLHHGVMKKFSYKFSDYVWKAMHDPSDTRSWAEKVDAAFMTGYSLAIKRGHKQLAKMLTQYSIELMKKPIMKVVNDKVFPKISGMLDTLQKDIPKEVTDILDVNGILTGAITDSIDDACKKIVEAQKPLFMGEVAKLSVTFSGSLSIGGATLSVSLSSP